MTTPFWCLLITILIPYVLTGMAGKYKKAQFGAVDNDLPRAQNALLEGTGARVYAAQLNAWEALPLFGFSVMVAHFAGANPKWAAVASVLFVVARVLHAAFYIAGKSTLRSFMFAAGAVCCLWLFGLAAIA